MSSQENQKNLSYALKFIVDKYGAQALLDESKVNAILGDLIPKNQIERNWIIDAINLGIIKILLNADSIDQNSQKESRVKAKNLFKSYYIEDVRSEYVLDNLEYALGWRSKEVEDLSYYRENLKKRKNTLNNKVTSNKEVTKKEVTNKPVVKKVENNQNKNKVEQNLNNNNQTKKIQPNNITRNTPNKKKNKVSILLPIAIILLLIFGITSLLKTDDIKVTGYNFSVNYEKEGSTYVFDKSLCQIQFVLEAKDNQQIENSKISFSVDDDDICNYLTLTDAKCFLTKKSNGTTKLHIYYDGEEIDSIKIKFTDSNNLLSKVEEDDTKISLQEQIDLDAFMRDYWEDYNVAINLGQISYIKSYLKTTGSYYKQLAESIPSIYEKGTKIEKKGFTKENLVKENGYYRYSFNIEHNIYKDNEDVYKKEYNEFIIIKEGNQYKIDRYENYKLINQYEI